MSSELAQDGFNFRNYPDSKVHGANMGPIWVLSAPDGPHAGPMNLAIRVFMYHCFVQEDVFETKTPEFQLR